MKNQIFIICIVCNLCGAAQPNWAPEGAVWHYDYYEMCYGGYTKISVVGDTIINNIVCSKLQPVANTAVFCVQPPECCYEWAMPVEYTYSDADRIYIWREDAFEILYDFTLEVGDSYIVGANGLCESGNLLVTETGTQEINGLTLRYYDVITQNDYSMFLNGRIVERIGNIGNGYLFPQAGCKIDEGLSGSFRCYSDAEFGFYDISKFEDCEYILSNTDLQNLAAVSIYPNPSASFISITGIVSIEAIKITDTSDRLVMTEYNPIATGQSRTGKRQIDVAHLLSGIYFIEVRTDESRVVLRFVKA